MKLITQTAMRMFVCTKERNLYAEYLLKHKPLQSQLKHFSEQFTYPVPIHYPPLNMLL